MSRFWNIESEELKRIYIQSYKSVKDLKEMAALYPQYMPSDPIICEYEVVTTLVKVMPYE